MLTEQTTTRQQIHIHTGAFRSPSNTMYSTAEAIMIASEYLCGAESGKGAAVTAKSWSKVRVAKADKLLRRRLMTKEIDGSEHDLGISSAHALLARNLPNSATSSLLLACTASVGCCIIQRESGGAVCTLGR